jgi:type IV fimbrial biogenesis protein FimT
MHELMLALAIFFIISVIGVPSYISFVRNGELSNTTTTLFVDLHYARSEAIKRKTKVTVCQSDDVTIDDPVCGSTSKTWTAGWLIFVDVGGTTGSYESASGDVLLRIGRPPTNNIAIMSNGNADDYFEFNNDGSLNITNAPVVYAVCDDRDGDGDFDEDTGRDIRIGAIGRPEITVGSITSCDSPS